MASGHIWRYVLTLSRPIYGDLCLAYTLSNVYGDICFAYTLPTAHIWRYVLGLYIV